MEQIYLDHAATTPVLPEVRRFMSEVLEEKFGNPSSIHRYGRQSRAVLDGAREQLAQSLGVRKGHQITFTSGGTEADNLALCGVALAYRQEKRHLVVSSIEHHAVLHACRQLAQWGFDVSYLPVDRQGVVELAQAEALLRDDTLLLSVMYGNNEVGTLQPLSELVQMAKDKDIFVHTDAVQAFAAVGLDISSLPVDLLSLSAHKIGGPKGVGALYTHPRVRLHPLLYGGAQEFNRRAGTENVPGIAGFAKAVQLLEREREARTALFRRCREALLRVLREGLGEDGFVVNGRGGDGLPHILNLSFPGTNTESLLMRLDLAGVAVSSGSACTSASLEPSYVLRALGRNDELAHSSIRFTLGRFTTEKEVDYAIELLKSRVGKLRDMSPLWEMAKEGIDLNTVQWAAH